MLCIVDQSDTLNDLVLCVEITVNYISLFSILTYLEYYLVNG